MTLLVNPCLISTLDMTKSLWNSLHSCVIWLHCFSNKSWHWAKYNMDWKNKRRISILVAGKCWDRNRASRERWHSSTVCRAMPVLMSGSRSTHGDAGWSWNRRHMRHMWHCRHRRRSGWHKPVVEDWLWLRLPHKRGWWGIRKTVSYPMTAVAMSWSRNPQESSFLSTEIPLRYSLSLVGGRQRSGALPHCCGQGRAGSICKEFDQKWIVSGYALVLLFPSCISFVVDIVCFGTSGRLPQQGRRR